MTTKNFRRRRRFSPANATILTITMLLVVASPVAYTLSVHLPRAFHPNQGRATCDAASGYSRNPHGTATYLLRSDELNQLVTDKNSGKSTQYEQLIAAANAALDRSPPSVTDKTLAPPSGDKHDYMSLSTYSWPDAKHPGQSLWRDGQYNPAVYTAAYDYNRLHQLVDDGEALGLAYYYTGDERYAKQLAAYVRRWFVDPATRMNPNLQYAQIDAAGKLGDGNGVIDGWHLVYLVDAIGLIQPSKGISPAENQALRAWFAQYLAWLQNSPQGVHELNALNNHAVFYDLERSVFALYAGNTAAARQIALHSAKHRLRQIRFWGALPKEESRANPTHYMSVTAMAFSHLAAVSECSGVDLWRSRDIMGGTIGAMIGRMARFVEGGQAWPTGKPPANGEPLAGALAAAGRAYNTPRISHDAQAVRNREFATDEDFRWGGLKSAPSPPS